MNMPRALLRVSMVVLFALLGCKDNGVIVDDRPPGIYGRAVNSAGGALDSVGIHYVFYTAANPVVLTGTIRYQLATPQIVTVTVWDPLGHLQDTLVDHQQQMAGNYWIMDDSSLTNGVYTWRVQAGDTATAGNFLIRDDDVGRIQTTQPLLFSGEDGTFVLSSSVLGIGMTIGGETIADSITIVACKPGYRTAVQTVRLEASRAVDKTVTLLPL